MSIAALSHKRAFDWDQSRENHAYSPCRIEKKVKLSGDQTANSYNNNRVNNEYSPSDTCFKTQSPQVNVERIHGKHTKNRRLRHAGSDNISELATETSQRRPTSPRSSNEVMYTIDQVKSIVSKALEEREVQLRAQYDNILQEKLLEQFNEFSRFNQDNIHKILSESTYSYMC
ncbi:hypothetical protein SARC_00047 [Sphaeroforma arctica JP610]|uniref:Akirin n=1 Tax=Sphaeroforma arctica JP610 TaxID=667725 RepID=A0A0L0GG02_9EUKA|nr:hypothetical protein SARC_00047 [Sphaeroforma arctica JP610]KNC87789.1 hypothetical protein SARC_00047 [Sphaeroforma arctica JP610]|eukprot:XP_014161691.1 hypothetical protein SARC_00047 [Sphaeroforma arctica JP610]